MSFVHGLTQADLIRLRAIVKHVHLKHYPKDRINDFEADKLIEAIGPEVAGMLVKAGRDTGFVS